MASNKMTMNAWSGPLAAAVGALYKDYATRPTAADALKAQLMQEQLQTAPVERQKLQLGNQSAQRLYDMGGWEGAPAIVQEKLFGDSLPAQDRGRYEDIYVTKPSWQDFGDQKVLMGVNGPINARTVGAPPRTEVKDGRVFDIPAMQSQPVNLFPSRQPALQQSSEPFPSELGQNRGISTRDIANAAMPMAQPVSMEELNAPVNTGRPPMPSMMPSQEGMKAGYGQPSAGISLPFASNDPQVNGGVQVTDLPLPAADVAQMNDKTFSASRTQNDLNDTFASALYNIENGGAGMGSYLKHAPLFGDQTPAGVLASDIDKITSKAAIDKIAQLKAESKTGGFFGNLSDGERKAVGDSVVSIKQAMDPQTLAYRLMMHQDIINDIAHGRGRMNPTTGEVIPMDAGAPRTGLPSLTDIQNAQSPDELTQMWDAFDKYSVFEGRPPQMIEELLAKRMNQIRGGQ